MSFYKMVDDRVELALRLEALIEDNAETTARALAEFFSPLTESISEEAWYEDELLRQRLLVRWSAQLRRQMVDAADTHRAKVVALERQRRHRNQAQAALYDELVEIRRQARRLFGKRHAPRVLGIRGRTRRKARPLARQAATAIHCFADPGAETTAGFEVRVETWRKSLKPLVEDLEAEIEATVRAKTATLVTYKAKQSTMKEFDREYGRIGRYMIGAYQLAGLDHLAAAVPPREARKSRRKSRSKTVRTDAAPAQETPPRRAPLANVVDLGRWVKQRLVRLTGDARLEMAEEALKRRFGGGR